MGFNKLGLFSVFGGLLSLGFTFSTLYYSKIAFSNIKNFLKTHGKLQNLISSQISIQNNSLLLTSQILLLRFTLLGTNYSPKHIKLCLCMFFSLIKFVYKLLIKETLEMRLKI